MPIVLPHPVLFALATVLAAAVEQVTGKTKGGFFRLVKADIPGRGLRYGYELVSDLSDQVYDKSYHLVSTGNYCTVKLRPSASFITFLW